MTNPDLPLRPITDDEWPAFWRILTRAFHNDMHQDEADTELSVFEPERSLAVVDGDEIVATAGAYTRELSVPGAVLPAAHVTMVSVLPTHRRRGLLTRMMRRQLPDIRQTGEPIAVLWASEEPIYGRYGYGPASSRISIEADTREVRVAPPPDAGTPGPLCLADPGEVVKDLAQLYDTVRRHRPGFSSRQGSWWDYRLTDPERRRGGATGRRCVLHETAGGVTGYALWRSKGRWDPDGHKGEVVVEEVVATDPAAAATLWRFLFDVDLTRVVTAWNVPPDDPLFHLVDSPQRLSRRLNTSLFTRIVDLPAALAARRYAAPVDLVIEVTDDLLPGNAGRWHLSGDATTATCERTSAPADLTLGIRELGAAYLGGTSLGALARAGLVRGRPEAVAAANAAFSWHVAPFAPEIF